MKLTDLQTVQSLNEQLQALYDLEQRLNSDAVADANSFSVAFTLIDLPRGLRQTILYIGSHDMNCPITLNELMDVMRQYIATKIGTLVSQLHDFGVVIPDASPALADGSYKTEAPAECVINCRDPECPYTHPVGWTRAENDGTTTEVVEETKEALRSKKKIRNLLHANTEDRNEH